MTHAGRAFRHMQEVAERLALGRECAQSPTVSKDSLHYGQRKSGGGARCRGHYDTVRTAKRLSGAASGRLNIDNCFFAHRP